ncbi:hypothetical protein [Natronomonas marina]|jgi:hypothetical protein|uniref:hypothetical protein n=1 Tax=Natronomonas marina TaxID=2961939 RepID=UPI0020C962CE|nr:hypothetical protein [Natronomonas marina]
MKERNGNWAALLPGIAPGAHKRNVIVLLVYVFLLLMALSLLNVVIPDHLF